MNELIERIKKVEKKKLLMPCIFFIVIIIILFGGAFIYNKLYFKRTYSEVENIMIDAAKSYTSKHKNELPKNINDFLTITVESLVNAKEMNSINSYLKDDTLSCNGNVTITNINNTYRYTPNLDCGEKYKTKKWIDYLKENNPIVEKGNGLYKLNEEFVFRGDNINNYLKLSGKLYRIVKLTNDETVIIYSEKTETTTWDNRYNKEKDATIGINDYSVSKIRDYLNNLYNNSNTIINKTSSFKNNKLIIAHNINFGKRNQDDTDKTGQLERATVLENQFIGLLPLNDYMNASLDQNCTTTTNQSCMNYNYLTDYQYQWWTLTADKSNTYKVYKIIDSVYTTNAANSAYIRPVFHLAKDAIYVSGDGTQGNPYIVK